MFSIQNSMTINKVNTGAAPNAFSSRRQDPILSNRIHRMPVDTYGRVVNYSTLTTDRPGGTTDPMPIIDNENEVSRPQYSTYLNVAEGLDGGYVGMGYDTMLQGSYLSRKTAYQEAPQVHVNDSHDSNTTLARMMQTKFKTIDYSN